jgi:branched-chain amino acid transport system permease protein
MTQLSAGPHRKPLGSTKVTSVASVAAVVSVVALGLAALAAVPLLATDFQLFRFTNILVYALALIGVNLLVGYNGQISLGHGAFYAVGAYATILLVAYAGVAHWVAVPMAGIVCLGVGFLFSLPVLRLQPMHLAMATFALGAVLPSLAKWKGVERWTGGTQGLGIDTPTVPFGLALRFDQWIYWLALLFVALSFWLTFNLLRGRVGRAAIAIRDHPIAAQSMGINNALFKAAIFGISALLVGMAGGLGALSMRYVAPGMFGLFLSFGLLIGIAVGGLGSLSGALYGAVCLQFIFLVVGASASSLQTANTPLIYGVVLILFLCFFPNGVAGLVSSAAARLRRVRPRSA